MLIAHLPPESAVAALHPEHNGWRLEHYLLDNVRMAVEASVPHAKPVKVKPHPGRTVADVTQLDPARKRKILAAQRRAQERRRQIEAGEIS